MDVNIRQLPEIYENVYQDVYITGVPSEGETVQQVTIVPVDKNIGITIINNRITGSYIDAFTFDSNSIGTVNKNDYSISYHQSWNNLPDRNTNNIFLWRAPKVLRTTFYYQITIKYLYTVDNGTGTSTSTQMEYNTTISQVVLGTWDTWARKLREYANG